MSDITPSKQNIQIQESQFRAAVSESTIQKIGGSINFINDYFVSYKSWILDDSVYSASGSLNFGGFQFSSVKEEIIDVYLFTEVPGGSSYTSIDIQYNSTPGQISGWTSIFSQAPQIAASAGYNVWVNMTSATGAAASGIIAPVIAVSAFNPGTAWRAQILNAQHGSPIGTGIVVVVAPSN